MAQGARDRARVYAEERQQLIERRAQDDGRVEVSRLAAEFGVTSETIRRDLTLLERRGVLRRVHGGAIPVNRQGFEPALAQRASIMVGEKERIGKAAVEELPSEGSVLIDAGTTTAQLAAAIPPDRALTVVTNAAPIAVALAVKPRITLVFLGGRVREPTLAAVGPWAEQALEDLHVDVAFIGTNGFSQERGCTTPDPHEASTKRAMVETAERAVLLADHTKHEADVLFRFAALEDFDVVVSDSGLDVEVARRIEAMGPAVVRA